MCSGDEETERILSEVRHGSAWRHQRRTLQHENPPGLSAQWYVPTLFNYYRWHNPSRITVEVEQCAFHMSHFLIATLVGKCALIVTSQYKKSLHFVYLPSILLLLYRSKAAVKGRVFESLFSLKTSTLF